MKAAPLIPPATARELLERVAGADHALHSVKSRVHLHPTAMEIVCTCGERFEVTTNIVSLHALRNVP